jgi:CO/xanthine dehydrogenase Mo-binding subunit
VAVEDLEIVEGTIQVKGVPEASLSLQKLASDSMRFAGQHKPVFAHGRHAITTQAPGFSAQLAEVSVDEETGEVRVHRLVVVQDVGKAINPLLVEGQMMGGAMQGLGWALHEQLLYDGSGQIVTASLLDYTMPNFGDVPPQFEMVLVEVPSETGPFGARGVGEPPIVPTAGAVGNAIKQLTGQRLTDLPMTAERVLKTLHGQSFSAAV